MTPQAAAFTGPSGLDPYGIITLLKTNDKLARQPHALTRPPHIGVTRRSIRRTKDTVAAAADPRRAHPPWTRQPGYLCS